MDYYERTATGTSPLSLAVAKVYLKIPVSVTADDVLIQSLINACTEYGEGYTARDFRANTYKLLTDYFVSRQRLIKNPVDSITSIKYLKADVLTTVTSTDYYKKDSTQYSEVLLKVDADWPIDGDDIEHAIEYIFVTKTYYKTEIILEALIQHVAYLYTNRGDCDCDIATTGKISGSDLLYNTIRIPRV